MKKIGSVLLLITAITLVKCKSNTHKKEVAKTTVETVSLNGFWKSIGYGQLLAITDETVMIYDINKVSCIPSEEFPREAAEEFLEIKLKNNNRLHIQMGINSYDFERINQFPEICKPLDEVKKKDPLYNFESLWQTFAEHYSYFKERKVDWNALKATYKSKLSSESTPLELYIVLKDMLNELNDGHVGIPLPDEIEAAYMAHKETKKKTSSNTKRRSIDIDEFRNEQLNKYVQHPKSYNYGVVNWGMINDDVMLIQINGMMQLAHYDIPKDDPEKAEMLYGQYAEESDNYTQDEIDGAEHIMNTLFPELEKAKTCIIDVRFNGGGIDEVALKILSYFTKEETTVFSKKAFLSEGKFTKENVVTITPATKVFNGNLFILTSPQSASATEIFVLSSLKATPNAIRIGSNTEGIFSDILEKQLPNGWEYGLSNEIYESVDGVNYENIGILSHHRIEYNRESGYQMIAKLQENSKDDAIEKVLELLKEN